MIQRYHCVAAALIWACLVLLPSSNTLAVSFDEQLVNQMARSAPNLNRQVLIQALNATECAVSSGVDKPERLAIIDFTLPSHEQRLWIFELAEGRLIMREWVAHGKNSGGNRATSFSNILESNQSSIGLFQANESYRGKHGYSLRLDGLEPGINDQARERAIVIHGADYVDPSWIQAYGRLGRSFGCPAVSREVIHQVVDSLKGGQLVFTYYPDQHWLNSSGFLNCDQPTVTAEL